MFLGLENGLLYKTDSDYNVSESLLQSCCTRAIMQRQTTESLSGRSTIRPGLIRGTKPDPEKEGRFFNKAHLAISLVSNKVLCIPYNDSD